MTTPTLYYIKHPLADKNLPEQTLATFTDNDIAEYKAEFEIYKSAQHDAVRAMSDMIDTCRVSLKSIFGGESDCKQVKYFDRMVRGGETLTDQHAKQYPRPSHVEQRITEAKEKYCNFIGSSNAPKASGDDTLQEINNAVAYLMEKGMALNSDFTISNAVSVAKASAQQDLDDHLIGNADGEGYVAMPFSLMLKEGSPFPTSSFAYKGSGSNTMRTKIVDMNLDEDTLSDSAKRIVNEGTFTYKVTFSHASTPCLEIC